MHFVILQTKFMMNFGRTTLLYDDELSWSPNEFHCTITNFVVLLAKSIEFSKCSVELCCTLEFLRYTWDELHIVLNEIRYSLMNLYVIQANFISLRRIPFFFKWTPGDHHCVHKKKVIFKKIPKEKNLFETSPKFPQKFNNFLHNT